MARLLAIILAAGCLGIAAPSGTALGAAGHAPAPAVLLGNHSPAPQRFTEAAGRSVAFRFAAVRSGITGTVHVYLAGSDRARDVLVGLYTSRHGRPGVRLLWVRLAHVRPGRWNAAAIAAVPLRRGRSYWLALLGRGGRLGYRAASGVNCGAVQTAEAHLTALPRRWPPGAGRRSCRPSAFIGALVPAATPVGSAPPAPGGGGGTGSGTSGGGAGGGTPSRTSHCFSAPGACGFPDPGYHNVGATSPCSAMPSSGPITVSRPGTTLSNHVYSYVHVIAADVTLDNVCVINDGQGQLGSRAILLDHGATNATIENVTVGGVDVMTHSVDQAIANDSSSTATVEKSYLYNCGECLWNGPWTVTSSYVITNGMQGTGDHLEDLYCSDTTVVMAHDVLLDPDHQNSAIFCDTNWGGGGACSNHITLTGSLLAGGGFVIYTCGNASSAGSSTMNISGNRFARCLTPPFLYNRGTGGRACRGSTGESIGSGADLGGYWPEGGYFGIDAAVYCPPAGGQTWSGNVWDDNNAPVGC